MHLGPGQKRLCVLGLALVAASAFVSPALAGRSLVVGVNEDAVIATDIPTGPLVHTAGVFRQLAAA